ncbi:uncharacterized protein LOC111338609 isoform X1 [Stylophora pistillata]|uniref:uncharacterized protein LOC111338609 isoform X1 n=1 Tax=Stylophora pistillata TaxID=50429 RepID=UPI000C04BC46|nr:uncharacterized protein LOC111338609 isoform X1 [Stylophora pistillata]
MPKRGAEVGDGNEDSSGHGVYHFIGGLIREGKDAKFVDKKGRYVLNWSRTLERYAIYKSKKTPHFKSKNINRRKASNGLRAALLNIYKKDGAKEYKESKKVNDKDEVIERQFQMPPKVFQSLFGSKVELSDDSDHETSSTSSEVDEKPQATPNTPYGSDTGFEEEAMDVSEDLLNMSAELNISNVLGDTGIGAAALQDNIKTEVQVDQPDIATPCQIFNISAEELDSALEEICSTSDNDEDQPGEVKDISPSTGSVKGGFQFHIMLTDELPESDTTGVAHFDGVGAVLLEKTNPYVFSGFIPAAQEPGPVRVTVYTEAGRKLGITWFMYVDEMREALKQLIKDPAQLSLFLTMWSQEHGIIGSNGDVAQTLGLFGLRDQGSLTEAKQLQSLKVLQLLVYTAAQEDAQQFLQMFFSTSAGKIVFNSYKDRTPLPEDVARASAHEELAEYLEDVNKRFSKESDSNSVTLHTIDWLELLQAVDNTQKQTVPNDEQESSRMQLKGDDNQSDYFADAETSSCGSLEFNGDWSDFDEGKGACPKEEDCEKAAIEIGNDDCTSLRHHLLLQKEPLRIPKENAATKEYFKVETQLGNGQNKNENPSICEEFSVVNRACRKLPLLHSFFQWLSRREGTLSAKQQENCSHQAEEMGSVSQKKGTNKKDGNDHGPKCATESSRQEKTTKSKKQRQRGHWRFETATRMRYILLSAALVTVLAGLKLGESQILHWAVGNGYTQFSKLLLKYGPNVDAPNFRMESPLHVAAKFGFVDLADVLTKLGSNVNAKTYQQQTPLHLAVWNGHQQIAAMLLQRGGDAQSGDVFGRTPVHLAVVQRRERMLEMLIQHGSALKARDNFGRTPLHLASVKGNERLVKLLIRHGCEISARDNSQKTALHLAAESGQDTIVHSLIMRGADIQATELFGQTPLHLAAQTGRTNVVKLLLKHGSIIGAVNVFKQTPLHLAAESGENGYKDILKELIQHGSYVNAVNIFGQTALHLAARKGHKNIVEVLVQHKSNVLALDDARDTALDIAGESGHQEIVELLTEHPHIVTLRKYFVSTRLLVAEAGGGNGSQQSLEISNTVLKSIHCNRSNLKAEEEVDQIILHFSSRHGKSRSLGSLTRVQRPGYMEDILEHTRMEIGQRPLQVVTSRNRSKEFDENKLGNAISASSFSPSFQAVMPLDTISSSCKCSCVCAPHKYQKYSCLEFISWQFCFVTWKQRRGLKTEESNLRMISSNIPICLRKQVRASEKTLQRVRNCRKPDIDEDACKVISRRRRYIEQCGLDGSQPDGTSLNNLPRTSLSTQYFSNWKRFIPCEGASLGPNLGINCAVNHQMKDSWYSDAQVFKNYSAENKEIHPCRNIGDIQPGRGACKGNGCEEVETRQNYFSERRKMLQQVLHYRKPDIDEDADNTLKRGRSYLEHFEPYIFNLSFRDLRRGRIYHVFFLSGDVSRRLESTREDLAKQCFANFTCLYPEQPGIKPQTLLNTQRYRNRNRFKTGMGTSSGPNLGIFYAVKHQTKDSGYSDGEVFKKYSAENEEIQPCRNNEDIHPLYRNNRIKKERDCKGNGCEVWTLAFTTENSGEGLLRKRNLQQEGQRRKRNLQQEGLVMKIILQLKNVPIRISYIAIALFISSFITFVVLTKFVKVPAKPRALVKVLAKRRGRKIYLKPSASARPAYDIWEFEPIEQELNVCKIPVRECKINVKKIKTSEKRYGTINKGH